MLSEKHRPSAVIGTNGAGRLSKLTPITNTTPGATELHQFFHRFVADGLSHVAMEVSSHALCQKRVTAELFDIAVFTNLSRDHLDYHGTMSEYALAKKQLFTGESAQVAVLNYDDEQAKNWLENWPTQQSVWLYGRDDAISVKPFYVMAKDIKHHAQGVSFCLLSHLGQTEITSPLLGDFNVDNLLAAICVLLIEGIELSEINDLVEKAQAVAGRMEAFSQSDSSLPTTVVDYAHTPDALEKALQACRQHCHGHLYVVFGCGGDRDKGKRALMAKAAEQHADGIVITNDNPRTEDAQSIANDILTGITTNKRGQVDVILDREQAVLTTLNKAKQGDIVLLAGKGHEGYIIMNDGQGGTKKINYDERALVTDFYQQHNVEASL
jgi:UDP-N-acetylmuramoyl-L-alanyl-D-glutamate--2,6-diaminopimelate ligase